MTLRIAPLLLALSLAACGQKGPLYLPDTTQGEVVTRPTQTQTTNSDGTTSGPSNSAATPDSPDRAASPAPEVVAPVTTDPDKDNRKNGATPPPKK
jgi:predicted small lipoprotein YifL